MVEPRPRAKYIPVHFMDALWVIGNMGFDSVKISNAPFDSEL